MSDVTTEDDLISITFAVPAPDTLQTQAGKDVECVDEVSLFPTITYKDFLSEVGFIMNVHPKLVSVGYRFSTSPKSDPVSSIKREEAFAKMFQDAIPLAIAAKKPGRRPFKVRLFEIKEKPNKETEAIQMKEKQVSNFSI